MWFGVGRKECVEGQVKRRLEGRQGRRVLRLVCLGRRRWVASKSHISPAARKCPGQYI